MLPEPTEVYIRLYVVRIVLKFAEQLKEKFNTLLDFFPELIQADISLAKFIVLFLFHMSKLDYLRFW